MRTGGTTANGRSFGLDLARAVAGVLVLTVHYLNNTGYYQEPLVGKCLFLGTVIRMACITSVPMFMLLTGYLCVSRTWSWGYYRKLLPILLTYLLAGLACMACRILWMGQSFTPGSFLREFIQFNAAPYGWYIEMYVGLFLMAPFFNAGWHTLDKRGKAVLIVTLASLSSVPVAVNSALGAALWPDWWQNISPLALYAVGAWLYEYPIRAKKRWLLLGWAGGAMLIGLWCYRLCDGKTYSWNAAFDWSSGIILIQAVLLFSCLRQCDGTRVPAPVRWCVRQVSRLSLGMYLISYVPEQFIYPVLNDLVPSVYRRVLWLPAGAATVVLCSCLLAQLVDRAVGALMRLMPDRQKVLKES